MKSRYVRLYLDEVWHKSLMSFFCPVEPEPGQVIRGGASSSVLVS